MMAAKDPITGQQPEIDPGYEALLKGMVTTFGMVLDTKIKNYVREIVEEVIKERDDAFIDKLNKISAQAKPEDVAPIADQVRESYVNRIPDYQRKAYEDGATLWNGTPEGEYEYDAPAHLQKGDIITFYFRNGDTIKDENCLGWRWSHTSTGLDIVGYKVTGKRK